MNHTQNYQLSQWAKSDKVQMEDFNADNAKIDGALKAQATAQTAMQTVLNAKGNCSIGIFSYTGTDKYGPDNPTRITFPRRPTAFIAFEGSATLLGLGNGSNVAVLTSTSRGTMYNTTLPTSWSGSVCSFYSNDGEQYQMNRNGIYYVIALYAES